MQHCQKENFSLVEICNDTVGVEAKNLLPKKQTHTQGCGSAWNDPFLTAVLNGNGFQGQTFYILSGTTVNFLNNLCGKTISVNETKEIN